MGRNTQRHLLRLRMGRERRRGRWEVRLQPREGAPFPAALTASLVRGPDAQVAGVQWLIRDITRLKRTGAEREPPLWKLPCPPLTPSRLLPPCAGCKRVRGAAGVWTELTAYLAVHFDLQVTHGLCPACRRTLDPEAAGMEPCFSGGELELPLQFHPALRGTGES